jgi:sugar/nucleoside kinase (ribokinase family)
LTDVKIEFRENRGFVVAQGPAAVDRIIACEHLPREDGIERIKNESVAPGGCGGNFLAALAALGVRGALVAQVGDDIYGKMYREDLKCAGISDRWLFEKAGGITMRTYVLVDAAGARMILVNHGDSYHSLSDTDVPEEVLDGADLFSTSGRPHRVALKLTRAAVKRNVPIITQLDGPPSRRFVSDAEKQALDEILRSADIVCAGREVFFDLSGEKDPTESVCKLYEKYKPKGGVICTAGKDGAYWYCADGLISCPIIPVEVSDTTGAGDSFCAGIAFEYFLNKKHKTASLAFACACGALKCTIPGPRLLGSGLEQKIRAMMSNWEKNSDINRGGTHNVKKKRI